MFAKVVKPATACREANYSRDAINIREAGTIGTPRLSPLTSKQNQ
jgi:hypothetical protein